MSDETYIFRVKIKEAYVIKMICELLYNVIGFAPFRVSEKGITMTQVDGKNEPEQLIDIVLYKEFFMNFRCSREFNFVINCKNLYQMLKSIKKKDNMILAVTEENPHKLEICLEKADEFHRSTTTINITQQRPEEFTLPEGYDSPVNMSTKDFQNMKTLNNISKLVKVTSKPSYIKFFCDGGELFTRKFEVGDIREYPDAECYVQHFSTHYITGLTKFAAVGGAGNIQIWMHPDLPMKIKIKAGTLGDVSIYIKSKELLEAEKEVAA